MRKLLIVVSLLTILALLTSCTALDSLFGNKNGSFDNSGNSNSGDNGLTDNNPTDDNPADDNPADDNPADDNPADDNPADDNPADDNPADDNPADDNPADDNPADDDPADDDPADDPEGSGNATVDGWLEEYDCITVSEALTLCEQFVSSPSSARYYMVVTIDSIDDAKYGQLTVSDSTGSIMVYGTRSADGSQLFEALAEKPVAGDTILIYGTLQNYNGNTKEVQNAWLIDFVSAESDDNGNGGDNGDGGSDNTSHTYTDFTTSEKTSFNDTIGLVIPFIPNDEYYVEPYTYEDEVGLNFYAFGNTAEEFSAYRAMFSAYTYVESYQDDYGDTWYVYQNGSVYVDMAHYYYEGYYVVDLYAYVLSGSTGGGSDEGGSDEGGYSYTDFTSAEKTLFNNVLGLVIPFVPNNLYYVEEYTYEDEVGINFYAYNNTSADYNAYRAMFSSYTYVESYQDDYGDTWYSYQKGDVYVDFSYYETDNGYVIDVYAYVLSGSTGGGSDEGGSDEGGSDEGGYSYTDFTSAEKTLFNNVLGLVIPFVPNNLYYVEEYTYEDEVGINFYAYNNTSADYNAYRAMFSSYTYVESYQDDYGDTWYSYQKGDVYVDFSYYETDNGYVIDVYAYVLSGSTGGGSDEGGDDVSDAPDTLITNDGKGLPTDADGVYDVDFTTAEYVKNVTEQGYYIGGCPVISYPTVLVIPVEFSDVTAASKGYDINKIEAAFNGNSYYSVHDYYLTSSYGNLDVQFEVLDFWFRPENDSSYYLNATMDYYGSEIEAGDQYILNEALTYLDGFMDLSEFDFDSNGMIDGVILINTLDVNYDVTMQWAYRYWNLYTDDDGNYYEYDGVSANDYMWASYAFLHEGYDSLGNPIYNDTSAFTTYTYIHEFGHVLGADDYYDTAYVGSPMGGYDVMDGMLGDHNAFTKFNFGWITTSRLVVTDSSVTLTLDDFSNSGDTILIANNWDDKLGAYQEYYIVVYYTNSGLNDGDYGYFEDEGIVVYHVNASLYYEDDGNERYYDVYNNNTSASDDYGTVDNLIEYVLTSGGDYVYLEGDTLPVVNDDLGNALAYTFVVDSIDDDSATITFSKIA